MATERTGNETIEQLRAKYAQLAAKYTALVRRIENRTQREAAVFRLGWFGVRAAGSAMALVERGAVTLVNPAWRRLAGKRTAWVPREQDESGAPRQEELPELALAEARAALAAKTGMSIEVLDSADGSMSLEVRAEVLSARDARVLVLANDVTAHVHREEELLQMREALLEKEHLRVLGELTASVTHHLGSTLRAIQVRIESLASTLELTSWRAALESLGDYVADGLGQLRELHRLARSGRLTPVPVRLDEVVRHAAAVLRLEQDPEHPIDLDVKLADLPPVIGTPAELSHVFVTLFRNAREAMPDGGKISITARRRSGFVTMCVRDEGRGIAADVMPHLFEPFFTTKGAAGTGLGLWLASSTMRRLGGSISAANRKTGGAEFVLRFPVSPTPKRALRAAAKSRPSRPSPSKRRVPA